MLRKIQWTHPWRIRHDVRKNYCGMELSHYVFAELNYDGKCFDIRLPEEKYYLRTDGRFYRLPQISILYNINVVPNEFLEFEIRSCMYQENKMNVKIKRKSINRYSLEVTSKELEGQSYYSPMINAKETLNKQQLDFVLQKIQPTFEVYPFILPFGNCFSETNL